MIHRRWVQRRSGDHNKCSATELRVIPGNWIWRRERSSEDLQLGYLLLDPERLQVPREFLLEVKAGIK